MKRKQKSKQPTYVESIEYFPKEVRKECHIGEYSRGNGKKWIGIRDNQFRDNVKSE